LHRQAAGARHRRAGRQVPAEVRQGAGQEGQVATCRRPFPGLDAGRAPWCLPAPSVDWSTCMSNDRLTALLQEYGELERRLADPAIHADQATARRIGRRFAELTPVHKAATELERVRADL